MEVYACAASPLNIRSGRCRAGSSQPFPFFWIMALLKIESIAGTGDARTIVSKRGVRFAEDIPEDFPEKIPQTVKGDLVIKYYPGRNGTTPVDGNGGPLGGYLEPSGASVYAVHIGKDGSSMGIPSKDRSFTTFIAIEPEGGELHLIRRNNTS